MSEDLDALADSARNRGLRLVRSRVRTPGKRRFGKVGLTDAAGKPLFGMDDKGPTATPDEVANCLRNLGAQDWGASLDVAVLPRRKNTKPRRAAANDAAPNLARSKSAPAKPKPPVIKVRAAKSGDARAIAALINILDFQLSEEQVTKNLRQLIKDGEAPFVATLDKQIAGLCGLHRMTAIHRPAPVGRITILVVAEPARDQGIGRLLLEAAECWCRDQGCTILEITSNDRLTAAHAFYRHLGYERTSLRFAKAL